MIKKIKLVLHFFKVYGFFGFFNLILDFCNTKLRFRRARLIRRPSYIRGAKYIDFNENFTSGVGLRIDCFFVHEIKPNLQFGVNCQLNDYVHIACVEKVVLGNNVLIASKVFITDHNHGDFKGDPEVNLPPSLRKLKSSPVIIKDNVWLGENVMVLPGVVIGENSIVGAGSVVTKSIPDNSIAVGAPAKVVKIYNSKLNRWVSVK